MPPDTYWCWLLCTTIRRKVNIELNLDRVSLFEDEFKRLCHPCVRGGKFSGLGDRIDGLMRIQMRVLGLKRYHV
jgi:hypothetical protein